MKKRGFTLVEVSILFVIFLIVAFLVAPLSMDDTVQANFTSRWKNVQSDFSNIFYSINTQKDSKDFDLHTAFAEVITPSLPPPYTTLIPLAPSIAPNSAASL